MQRQAQQTPPVHSAPGEEVKAPRTRSGLRGDALSSSPLLAPPSKQQKLDNVCEGPGHSRHFVNSHLCTVRHATLDTCKELTASFRREMSRRIWASLVAQRVKRLPAMWETWVRSLAGEDPLEKEMATHSSILAWKTPWMEEHCRLQPMGSQSRTQLSNFTYDGVVG